MSLAGAGVDGAASAAAAPDSAAVAALRSALAGESVVRVRGAFGVRDFYRIQLDSLGIHPLSGDGRVRRPSLIVVGDLDPAPAPRPIPWAEISAVETGGGHLVSGFAIGTLAAVAGSFVILAAADWGQSTSRNRAFGAARVLGLTLPIGGAIIGARLGWRKVYPASPPLRP
jgi:hypothetical protein